MYPRLFALIAVTLLTTACAMQRAVDSETAQKLMIGKSKEDVFVCMGIPNKKATEGETEIWRYKSGNNHTEKTRASIQTSGKRQVYEESLADSIGAALSIGEDVSTSRYCIVHVIFKDDTVKAITYSGPTGGFLTEDEQCAYATRNCLN